MEKEQKNGNDIVPYGTSGEDDIFSGLDEKEKRKSRGVWIVIIILAFAVGIVGTVTFTDFKLLRPVKQYIGVLVDRATDFFSNNETVNKVEGVLDSNGLEKTTNILPFENAANSWFAIHDSNVIVTRSNYIAQLNKNGKITWETVTSIAEPLLDISGDYIVIADRNGKGICLYYKNKLVYSAKSANPIMTVNASADGDVVVTTDKEFYKGGVEVFNKSGRQIFSWNSGSEYVMGAAISKSSRRVAVVLMSAEDKVKTNIQFFDINKTEGYYTASFDNSAVTGVKFTGNILDITADNCIAGLKLNGKTKWYTEYKDGSLVNYACDTRGNKIITTETDAVPAVKVYAEGGKLLSTLEVEDIPDYVDIMGRNIIYNSSRSIYFGVPDKTKKFTASMDIKNLKIIDSSSCLVVYNNSLEFISS